MIELGEQQREAIDKITTFCRDNNYTEDNIAFSLTGSAGTGKSTCLSYLIETLTDINITLCALTHKASIVLTYVTGKEAFTLHKVLSLSPNLSLEKLNLKNLRFYQNNAPTLIPYRGLLIIDEASMINNNLYKLLLELCMEYECKILYVSDSKQLQPVRNNGLSLVYKCKNKYELTQIFRQNEKNSLIQVLNYLRERPIFKSEWLTGNNGYDNEYGKFVIERNRDRFIQTCYDIINRNENSKILCYTNNMVRFYNEKLKSMLYVLDDTNPYPQGCLLTGYSNVKEQKGFGEYEILNGADYKIITSEPATKPYIYGVNRIMLSGYKLLLKEINGSFTDLKSVFLLDENNDYETIANWIEKERNEAVLSKRWQIYYRLTEAFCSFIDINLPDGRTVKVKNFDYGYAQTVHRSQGSTYDNVMIDMNDLYICRKLEELRQLQYVGLSRTKKDIYMYLC